MYLLHDRSPFNLSPKVFALQSGERSVLIEDAHFQRGQLIVLKQSIAAKAGTNGSVTSTGLFK